MTEPLRCRVCLADGVRLRREHFGGLAYSPHTGDTIDLDRGAFRFLELSREGDPPEYSYVSGSHGFRLSPRSRFDQ